MPRDSTPIQPTRHESRPQISLPSKRRLSTTPLSPIGPTPKRSSAPASKGPTPIQLTFRPGSTLAVRQTDLAHVRQARRKAAHWKVSHATFSQIGGRLEVSVRKLTQF